jgi:hypothetical protein
MAQPFDATAQRQEGWLNIKATRQLTSVELREGRRGSNNSYEMQNTDLDSRPGTKRDA